MKTIYALLFSLMPLWQNNPKNVLTFDFIEEHPIKIDGECSFFTYDTTAL